MQMTYWELILMLNANQSEVIRGFRAVCFVMRLSCRILTAVGHAMLERTQGLHGLHCWGLAV